MDRTGCCDRLSIDEARLEEFIALGMPWHGESADPEFDESECATWLFVNGKAEIDREKVCRTAVDATVKLGVSLRTLTAWSHLDGFPGRPGYYPIAEIEEWDVARNKKLNQHATQADVDDETCEKLSVKERRDLLKLKREEGLLVEVEEVKRDVQRANACAVAELNLLSGKIESRLPAGLDLELVQIIRETIKATVAESLTILSEQELDYKDDGLGADD